MTIAAICSLLIGLIELLAVYLVGKKNKYGFLAGIGCNIGWITYVLVTGLTPGLVFVSLGAFYLNIKGYRYWVADERKENG